MPRKSDFYLKPEEHADLDHIRSSTGDPDLRRRVEIVLSLNEGHVPADIAERFGISTRTVYHTFQQFRDGKLRPSCVSIEFFHTPGLSF